MRVGDALIYSGLVFLGFVLLKMMYNFHSMFRSVPYTVFYLEQLPNLSAKVFKQTVTLRLVAANNGVFTNF